MDEADSQQPTAESQAHQAGRAPDQPGEMLSTGRMSQWVQKQDSGSQK